MKLFLFVVLIHLSMSLSAQLKVDSLLSELKSNTKFKVTDTIEYLMESFIRFENSDFSEKFDVYFDSTGNIGEYIGLSIVYKKFDQKGRVKLIAGYNKKGKYSYWDFPPYTIFEYKDSTLVSDLSIICKNKLPNSIGNIQKVSEYDENLKMYGSYIKESNLNNNLEITKRYTPKGKLKKDENNVSVHFFEFDSIDLNFIKEERFYNDKFELVEALHTIHTYKNISIESNVKYAFSKREKIKTDKESLDSYFKDYFYLIKLYDSKGKLVDEIKH